LKEVDQSLLGKLAELPGVARAFFRKDFLKVVMLELKKVPQSYDVGARRTLRGRLALSHCLGEAELPGVARAFF
jgi:hypothetical protein